jgi:hypothetical protein
MSEEPNQPAPEQEPYLLVPKVERVYNPKYGDDRVCVCGHAYYRHFDTYDSMYPCGCKYCQCHEFQEDTARLAKGGRG